MDIFSNEIQDLIDIKTNTKIDIDKSKLILKIYTLYFEFHFCLNNKSTSFENRFLSTNFTAKYLSKIFMGFFYSLQYIWSKTLKYEDYKNYSLNRIINFTDTIFGKLNNQSYYIDITTLENIFPNIKDLREIKLSSIESLGIREFEQFIKLIWKNFGYFKEFLFEYITNKLENHISIEFNLNNKIKI